jgi:amino acid efflux transporter
LYLGAVLGTGVIALPALAARVAGPASLIAWAILVLVSIPLAATFAALGARYPDSGGVSTYARRAFGDRTAAVVGWCFAAAVPPAAAAAALFGGDYLAAAVGGGRTTASATAVGLLATVTLTNAFGVSLTGRVQLLLASLLVAFLVTAVVVSAPHARATTLHPFAPEGWTAVGPATALLVWGFVGWEAITHLAGEFRRPERDLPRATAAALVLIAVLYLAVAVATVTVLGPDAARSPAPLGDLLAVAWGGDARTFAAVPALLLTLGTMNAYFAGAAKLGAALARDGAFPAALAAGAWAGEVPRRAHLLNSSLSSLALLAVVVSGIGARPLVLVTTGLFVTVYAVGIAAAIRLLPPGAGRRTAVIASVGLALLIVTSGVWLLGAGLVALAALLYQRHHSRPVGRHPRSEGRTRSV